MVSIRLPKAPTDWSTHTHVRLFMHSAVKTGSGFIIMLDSDDPASGGHDYYHLRFPINWEGWKEFRIPVRKIGPARKKRTAPAEGTVPAKSLCLLQFLRNVV